MAAYATAADLTARYDLSDVCDLASDNGTPEGAIASSERITAVLEDASGRVESAAFVGGLYTADDLESLTGNSEAFLKRLVCDIAYCLLLRVRPGKYSEDFRKEAAKESDEWLDRLRTGKNIFSISKAVDASVIDVDGPTAASHSQLNLLTTRTHNFYPSVSSRFPTGKG